MPSSPNRRRIELPAALYARLEALAERSQMTTAALAAALLAAALDQRQPYREIGEQLRQLVEAGSRQEGELRALRELIGARASHAAQGQGATGPDATAQRLTRAGKEQDYRYFPRYRVARTETLAGPQGAARTGLPFGAILLAGLPPVVGEYLRLTMLSDIAYSDQLREHFREQAAALRRQLEAVQPATPGERSDE